MKPVILIVIDGLTPSMLESAVDSDRTPALSYLFEHGTYGRATSTFPSLTPVCLSSIATGAHPDVHHVPHLVWYHRGERRLVEYGSSFGAVRAAGIARSLSDTIFAMNEEHLSRKAVTVYEALEDAGLTAAAINITCYRGRTRHAPTVRGLTKPAFGPKRFFWYSLFESDETGAPLAVRSRTTGSVDAYAAAVGRWLVTRDGFDFLVFYLPDYDYASHAQGPDEAHEALVRSDHAIGALMQAAGGPDELLDRYAVLLCSDHGQTLVERASTLQEAFAPVAGDVVVTASNRAGMVYRLPRCRLDALALARLLDGNPAVDVVLWRDGDEARARREGEDLPLSALSDFPDGPVRAAAALANPNAGELIVSAAPGWELADLGGRHHLGGGSHGSLSAGDSEVPMLAVGLDVLPSSITDVAPAVLRHFGVALPPYARGLARAA